MKNRLLLQKVALAAFTIMVVQLVFLGFNGWALTAAFFFAATAIVATPGKADR